MIPVDDCYSSFMCFLQSFDDIVKKPGPKTTYEVAIFASDSWKKVSGFIQNVSLLIHLLIFVHNQYRNDLGRLMEKMW